MHETTRHYGRPPRPVIEPTLLTLVRHGQTTGNVRKLLSGVSDDPLTGFGRRQAAAMGRALSALILNGTLPPSTPSTSAHSNALATRRRRSPHRLA